MWSMTHDMQQVVNMVSIIQVPSFNGLGVILFWRFGGKGSVTDWMNELITKVLVEQPRLHQVC